MSKCFISKTYVDVKSSTDFDNVRSNEGVEDAAIWFCDSISLRDEQDALCIIIDSDSIWSDAVCFRSVLSSINNSSLVNNYKECL